MIYYDDGHICIRKMKETDIDDFTQAFINQGWENRKEVLASYYTEQNDLKRIVLVADFDNAIAGYLTLIPSAEAGPFYEKNIPEIKDFNVLIKYRCKGVGTKLMDAIESIAKENHSCISLGVGLYPDYGAAQIMYVKRGYIPDGSGIWHGNNHLNPYEECINDDDLNLYFIKQLET